MLDKSSKYIESLGPEEENNEEISLEEDPRYEIDESRLGSIELFKFDPDKKLDFDPNNMNF